ncbi:hypothetical protein GCM10009641_61950 [Mycobacterium cookii]|uniref:Uncharacterized protein n=1 Tax=Mycobacterium cookii TaxID=1775 RepID=A0A7I7KW73_9MYCO|nr:hypothetical protein MCOO_20890 [Mycobacterium cookii]
MGPPDPYRAVRVRQPARAELADLGRADLAAAAGATAVTAAAGSATETATAGATAVAAATGSTAENDRCAAGLSHDADFIAEFAVAAMRFVVNNYLSFR